MRLGHCAIAQLTIGAVLLALSSCVMAPVPAVQESTRYDSLPEVRPGSSAAELESRYGPPALKCADESMWVYGWSVGHGAFVAAGLTSGWGRLYYRLHVAFLWFDAEQRLVRIDVPEETQTDVAISAKPICTADGTCIEPNWTQWNGSVDRSWVCSGQLNVCEMYFLAGDSIVTSGDKRFTCTQPDDAPR